ncbi:A24 family peptidase [Alkalicoccus saliphilus]|uniref:Prepilin peptidase n=1 Tax=Alkalicoccus saliphilus TaxID=200989 RepID=A0A2T4U6Y6_9BACI|nr:prepilin peptidase [Alkalicoccus saliphilus]PTL39152.1 prepilin peptidase [Alkalicoccus saliphilus]
MTVVIIAVLGIAVGVSLITDLSSRRILNIITFPAILLGFILHTASAGLEGFFFSGTGFLVGLGLLLIPFFLGGMGAGDVKLMAAVGALMGTGFVLSVFLFAGITGGLMALYMIARDRGAFTSAASIIYAVPLLKGTAGSFKAFRSRAKKTTLPYGVAIAAGTIITFAGSVIGGVLPV